MSKCYCSYSSAFMILAVFLGFILISSSPLYADVDMLYMEISGYFLTKIFHPNIATNGEICVNTLKKDWNPSLGLRHVLIVSIHPRHSFADVWTILII